MKEEIIMTKDNMESLAGMFAALEDNIKNKCCQSREFDYVYCQIAGLTAAWIEYAIENETDFNTGYPINKGLIVGLYVRIFKILVNIDKLIYKDSMSYDVAMQLSRKTIELCATAQYLLVNKDNEEILESYRYKSLNGEQIFCKRINGDGKDDNETAKTIQCRMSKSIVEKFKMLEIDLTKNVKGFGKIESIFDKIGNKELYDIPYRLTSHSIHADAMSTVTCDLLQMNHKFFPQFEPNMYDIRLYNPNLIIIICALEDFVETYNFNFDKDIFLKEAKLLLDYIEKLEKLHEDYLVSLERKEE